MGALVLVPVRPWSSIPIAPVDEPLEMLPSELLRIEPHPYAAVGAPYGDGASPFRLRQQVVARLLQAQTCLQQQQPQWRLAIFDAWRPLAVQRFMVEHAIQQECDARGIHHQLPSPERDAVVAEVGRFWAPPCEDPAMPPPHSTGAAVDLTLACLDGQLLDLGSPIDAIGAVSEPDHYRRVAERSAAGDGRTRALLFDQRRDLLRQVMEDAGFARHPNEWWHFSWGDQLWAWRTGSPQARYGRWQGG